MGEAKKSNLNAKKASGDLAKVETQILDVESNITTTFNFFLLLSSAPPYELGGKGSRQKQLHSGVNCVLSE